MVYYVPTCPSTGEGEEPVVMVAGVKAERCRSCAEGTLSEGFWLVDEVGHASHPSLSDWLAVLEGQLEIHAEMTATLMRTFQTHQWNQMQPDSDKTEPDLRGAKIGPVTVGRGRGGGGVSRRGGRRGHWLLGWGGRGWGRCTQADWCFTVGYPLGIIGWKPTGASSELSSQPARLTCLGFIHLWQQRGGVKITLKHGNTQRDT